MKVFSGRSWAIPQAAHGDLASGRPFCHEGQIDPNWSQLTQTLGSHTGEF